MLSQKEDGRVAPGTISSILFFSNESHYYEFQGRLVRVKLRVGEDDKTLLI